MLLEEKADSDGKKRRRNDKWDFGIGLNNLSMFYAIKTTKMPPCPAKNAGQGGAT